MTAKLKIETSKLDESAIYIMKTILVIGAPPAQKATKPIFLKVSRRLTFKKTDFGVSGGKDIENTKIGF
jgi:hypothetical protein